MTPDNPSSAPRYKELLDQLHDGVYFCDTQRRINYWNKAAEEISGYSSDEVCGSHCHDNILVHVDHCGNQLCKSNCPLKSTMMDGASRESEVFLHHRDGHRVPVSVRCTPVRDASGKITGGVELFSPLRPPSVYEKYLQNLEKASLLDELTRTPNRRALNIEAEKLRAGMLIDHVPFGALFCDIDNFKSVNDKYGHTTGDKILKTVAMTLNGILRNYDILGRWGGEEFVGFVRNVDLNILREISERACRLVNSSHIITDQGDLRVTVSIGATLAREDESTEETIHRADQLMYRAKRAGKNRAITDD